MIAPVMDMEYTQIVRAKAIKPNTCMNIDVSYISTCKFKIKTCYDNICMYV
jgi:hypothetical protein